MSKPNVGDLIAIGREPNRGNVVITPSTVNQTILEGWHEGGGYVKGDANLKAENILNGTSIFGVTGTLLKGAAIKSLQTGDVSLSGKTSLDIPISNVDVNNSIVLITLKIKGTGSSAYYYSPIAKLTSPTNLRLERGGDNSSRYPIVFWQVVEFEGLKSLQTGTVDASINNNTVEDVPISNVNVNSTIVLVTFKAAVHNDSLLIFATSAKLTSPTNLRLERGDTHSSAYPIVFWQVIEF
jgi:hypothetical protein